MENAQKHSGVLLHVENDGPIRAAEAGESRRGRVEVEAGLHSQLHQAQPGADHEQQQEHSERKLERKQWRGGANNQQWKSV